MRMQIAWSTAAVAAAVLAGTGWPAPAAAQAARMAADRGCYNCHGEPPRRNVRSFAQIAASYAALRGKPGAEKDALDRMHHGSLLSHVAAHERLSDEDAAAHVHWLFQGGS
ncbi:MAG: hypothetical protein ACO1PB_02215 [Ramlibacter sp.]